MKYTVSEITNNIAKVTFSDGTWTFIELQADMTEAIFDDYVANVMPPHLKTGSGTPSFLKEGQTRTATKITVDPNPSWLDARLAAYGTLESQIEYITENGLDAWQSHVAKIKSDNPKS
tara:strand:- start:410 stop:763 length:354 start_codon:yes stop_codon:yes gene_type:complete